MSDALITCIILGGTIALFISDRLRLDVVALLSLLALALSGVVSLPEALAGFSSPALLMIAGLFVVGAALSGTGVADWLGQRLERSAGESEGRVTLAVMGVTTLLSAFMSSTGTVAILLPVVGTLAQRRGIAPARLLMPLAFAAHLGSNLTLISTPPNMLVSDALRSAGREPFHFFSFFGPGVIVLVVGVAYMVLFGRRALQGAQEADSESRVGSAGFGNSDLAADYGFAESMRALRIPAGSPLVSRTLGQANLRAEFAVTVLGIERPHGGAREACRVLPGTVFAAGDELHVIGREEDIARMAHELRLTPLENPVGFPLAADESLAEAVLPRRSKLVGRTLRGARFRDRYRANVLGLRRADGSIKREALELRDLVLRAGDTLLLKGRLKYLRNLRNERKDLVLVAEPDAQGGVLIDQRGALLSVAITLAMLVVMAFGVLPNVIVVLAAVAALVLTGCVRQGEIYTSINWESVVLIACMLPLATALETSGALAMLVSSIEGSVTSASPTTILSLLVAATSLMGMVLSNTATAVLLSPVAVRLAEATGIAPEPLLMGVAFASSAAFATPISSPVNVLVMGPAGYRFSDFIRVGVPLLLLVLATTVLVVPLWFSF